MATATQSKNKEEELALQSYIVPVQGKRIKPIGKVKIPHFNELPKVRGIFKNLEAPGTGISFPARFWKGPVMTFHLMDGQEYVIPKVVADHLNENCTYKFYQWKASNGQISNALPPQTMPQGMKPIGEDYSKEISRKQYRYMFQILGDA